MGKRSAVFPAAPHALYAEHGYSPAVRANGLLFVSGQVGARSDGTPAPDLADEVALAFANLTAVLAGAGCTPADVVDVQIFTTDPEAVLPLLFAHHPAYWGDAPLPALTATGVTWLAGFRFELKVVARLLLPHLDRLALIEISFPKFRDGRGYSAGRILREAGYTGELRAEGDVLVDQIPLMRRCGFDSFAPAAPVDAAALARALERYDHVYQSAADAQVPVWKLRHG